MCTHECCFPKYQGSSSSTLPCNHQTLHKLLNYYFSCLLRYVSQFLMSVGICFTVPYCPFTTNLSSKSIFTVNIFYDCLRYLTHLPSPSVSLWLRLNTSLIFCAEILAGNLSTAAME